MHLTQTLLFNKLAVGLHYCIAHRIIRGHRDVSELHRVFVYHRRKLVSADNPAFDPVQALTDYADHLNAICSPGWWPKVFYELMSGALVWSDETNSKTPMEVIWAYGSLSPTGPA